MFIEKEYYYEINNFNQFGLNAYFTKKNAGNFSYDNLISNHQDLFKNLNLESKKIIFSKQTHSNNILELENYTENIFDYDGFITKNKNLILITQHADCLPIFIYDKQNEIICLLHSGWKGSFQKIGLKAIDILTKKYKSKLENLLIALGIGIDYKNYEVSLDFYNNFKKDFHSEILEKSFYFENDKIFFDNEKFNFELFKNKGINKKNIISSNLSTFDNKFHSFRRDKEKSGRNIAVFYFQK